MRHQIARHRFVVPLAALAALFALSPVIGCGGPEVAPEVEPASPAPPVVEIRTTDYAFHFPSELPSGWTTLRLTNEGDEAHFLSLWRLPEGKSFDDYVTEVYDPFMEQFRGYKAGELGREEMLERLGEVLPEWLDLGAMGRGGVGLTSPGRTATTTVELVPGTYAVECYMVTAEDQAHNELGMLRPLVVTEEATGAAPPAADAELRLSNQGIAVVGELGRGEQTIRVTVTEPAPGLLGHDAHLARLDGADLTAIVPWMSWIDGLIPPAPAEFLGGAEQVPPGHASFVTVQLEPGRYAWISEGYAEQGLVEELRID